MLVLPPVPYRLRRRQIKQTTRPPGVALMLVFAYYDENVGVLRLQFDRAINIAALNGTAITVKDGPFDNAIYNGISAVSVIDPATIDLTLVQVGSWGGDEVTLTATANSGIVAVNDGGTWPGAMNLALPFA